MSTGSADHTPVRLPVQTRRLVRFFIAAGFGLAAAALSLALPFVPVARWLLALDVFFAAYLIQMLRRAAQDDATLRAQIVRDDEGAWLISALGVLAFATSLGAVVNVLAHPGAGLAETVLGFLAVPLGWGTVHALAAHHYAFLHYGGDPEAEAKGGLSFPGKAAPVAMDFLYFAYCVGMSAQVSDVAVTNTEMRRVVTVHAICSFFANAVIIALAVNAAASLHF